MFWVFFEQIDLSTLSLQCYSPFGIVEIGHKENYFSETNHDILRQSQKNLESWNLFHDLNHKIITAFCSSFKIRYSNYLNSLGF